MVPPKPQGGDWPTAGMKVKEEGSQSRSAVEADRQIEGGTPGIRVHGGVPSTYSPGLDPLDMWVS